MRPSALLTVGQPREVSLVRARETNQQLAHMTTPFLPDGIAEAEDIAAYINSLAK